MESQASELTSDELLLNVGHSFLALSASDGLGERDVDKTNLEASETNGGVEPLLFAERLRSSL